MIASRRLALALVLGASVGLLAYSASRAATLSFTHDEANTFDLLEGNLYWKTVANHHPLNTLLMRRMREWFGPAEVSLRFPNVAAHALYLITGFLLLRRARHPGPLALGFSVANLNPFLLDFFGLARGYGLSLGLSMAALWLLAEARERPTPWTRAPLLFAAMTCASLADLGNYTWLNLHLPLLSAALLVLVVDDERLAFRQDGTTLAIAVALVAANAVFIRNIVVRVRRLQKAGELYARGEIGFLPDTVGSLIRCYLYEAPYRDGVERAAFLIVVAGLPMLLLAVGYSSLRLRRASLGSILALAMTVAIAVPMVEHALIGAPYPNERIALYYFPLAGAVVALGLDELLARPGRIRRLILSTVSMTLAAAMALHFASTANLSHTLTWKYDASTRDAMREIERYYAGREKRGRVRVGNTWIFQPAMEYYRKTLGYSWMGRVRRDNPIRPGYEVLYLQTSDALPGLAGYRTLKAYPAAGSAILVRDSPPPGN